MWRIVFCGKLVFEFVEFYMWGFQPLHRTTRKSSQVSPSKKNIFLADIIIGYKVIIRTFQWFYLMIPLLVSNQTLTNMCINERIIKIFFHGFCQDNLLFVKKYPAIETVTDLIEYPLCIFFMQFVNIVFDLRRHCWPLRHIWPS